MSLETDFIYGLALEGLASITQQNLIDFLVKAQASETKALIIHSNDTPDVASNPRYARYIWHKLTDHTLNYYNGSSWVVLSLGSVTVTAQINDGTITLSKLSLGEGRPGDVLRKDPNTSTPSWMAVSTLFTLNIVPLLALDHSTATDRSFLRVINGSVTWDTIANVKAELGIGNALPTPNVAPSILRCPSGTTIQWQGDSAFFSGLANGIIPPVKLNASGASNGQVLTLVGGAPAWVSPAAGNGWRVQSKDIPFSVSNNIATFPCQNVIAATPPGPVDTSFYYEDYFIVNNLITDVPKFWRAVIRFQAPEGFWKSGEEIPLECLSLRQIAGPNARIPQVASYALVTDGSGYLSWYVALWNPVGSGTGYEYVLPRHNQYYPFNCFNCKIRFYIYY